MAKSTQANVWTGRWQHGATGFVQAMLVGMQYAVGNNYLQLEGNQSIAYATVLIAGLAGYYQKAYAISGWLLVIVCLDVLTSTPFPIPACRQKDCFFDKPTPLPDNISLFAGLSIATSFGNVVVCAALEDLVPADGTSFFSGSVFASLCIALLLNGKEYGGSFNYTVAPNAVYALCIVPAVISLFLVIFCLKDRPMKQEKATSVITIVQHLVRQYSVVQLCLFQFLFTLFASMDATPHLPISATWCGVEPLSDALSRVWSSMIVVMIRASVSRIHDRRMLLLVGCVSALVYEAGVTLSAIWFGVRGQWLFSSVRVISAIPMGLRLVVASECARDLADSRDESLVFDILTTVSTASTSIASVLYRVVDSYFPVSQRDISRDEVDVRGAVSWCYVISYKVRLMGLVWLVLLPPNRDAVKISKLKNGQSRFGGVILVCVVALSVVFSFLSSMSAILPSLAYYRVAGGQGAMFNEKYNKV